MEKIAWMRGELGLVSKGKDGSGREAKVEWVKRRGVMLWK